jgi:hypothetical protein
MKIDRDSNPTRRTHRDTLHAALLCVLRYLGIIRVSWRRGTPVDPRLPTGYLWYFILTDVECLSATIGSKVHLFVHRTEWIIPSPLDSSQWCHLISPFLCTPRTTTSSSSHQYICSTSHISQPSPVHAQQARRLIRVSESHSQTVSLGHLHQHRDGWGVYVLLPDPLLHHPSKPRPFDRPVDQLLRNEIANGYALRHLSHSEYLKVDSISIGERALSSSRTGSE